MSQRLWGASRVCAILILGAGACWIGCGGDDAPITPPGTGGAGGAGGTGGMTTSSGGGGIVPSFGPPGSDFVSSGKVLTNSRYRLVFTVGQSTQNQGKMTTSRYRLQGGVIGVNESLP